jgi:hypothetical protein
MIHFSRNTHIYRPLQQVFAFVASPENDFQWQYGTFNSVQVSEGELGLGTLFRTVGHFMGRRIESIFEVTEFDLNQRYGFKSCSGPVDVYTLYTFEALQNGTKLLITIQINPGDLFKVENVAAEKKVKKQYDENLALLKSVLETIRVGHS